MLNYQLTTSTLRYLHAQFSPGTYFHTFPQEYPFCAFDFDAEGKFCGGLWNVVSVSWERYGSIPFLAWFVSSTAE